MIRLMPADKSRQLQFISDMIDEIMWELDQLKENPASRETLCQQIIRLGAMYRAIRNGDDLFVQAR